MSAIDRDDVHLLALAFREALREQEAGKPAENSVGRVAALWGPITSMAAAIFLTGIAWANVGAKVERLAGDFNDVTVDMDELRLTTTRWYGEFNDYRLSGARWSLEDQRDYSERVSGRFEDVEAELGVAEGERRDILVRLQALENARG